MTEDPTEDPPQVSSGLAIHVPKNLTIETGVDLYPPAPDREAFLVVSFKFGPVTEVEVFIDPEDTFQMVRCLRGVVTKLINLKKI